MITIILTIKCDENEMFEASNGWAAFVIRCFVSTPFMVNATGVIIANRTATHAGSEKVKRLYSA